MKIPKNPDFSSLKKVLVAKLRHLGDVLLSTPVFSSLKQAYPHLQIDAYIYEESLPILESHPAIHKFLTYDRNWKKLPFFLRMQKELALLWEIRKQNYDLVINLTEGDRCALAGKFSKAPFRVGFDPEGKGLLGKEFLYTHIVKEPSLPRHSVEKNLDALRVLGFFPKEEERKLFFFIPQEALLSMQSLLKHAGFLPGNFILFHLSARWRFKCLPITKAKNIVHLLIQRGEKVVISVGKDEDEKAMAQEVANGFPSSQVFDLAGKISLKELGALIQMSKVLISVDSLPFHMASALKKPSIAIFGPTSEIIWGPWQNPYGKVVFQNFSCRPCCMAGCANSRKSDCLDSFPENKILEALDSLFS